MTTLFILSGFKEKRKAKKSTEGKWSGTVSFSQKITGTEAHSEWHMDANITNDTVTVVQTYKTERCQCRKVNKTELEVGIDEKRYSIFVPVDGCHGTCYDGKEFGVTDETGIGIDNQPPGKDHNLLSGNIVHDTTFGGGVRWVDTYTWNLKKN